MEFASQWCRRRCLAENRSEQAERGWPVLIGSALARSRTCACSRRVRIRGLLRKTKWPLDDIGIVSRETSRARLRFLLPPQPLQLIEPLQRLLGRQLVRNNLVEGGERRRGFFLRRLRRLDREERQI